MESKVLFYHLLFPYLRFTLPLQSRGRKALNNSGSKSVACEAITAFFCSPLECLLVENSALTFLFHLQKFVLHKVVKGANIAMLAASICSAFVVLVMAYLGCRSLPRCSCYDSVTGMVSEGPWAPTYLYWVWVGGKETGEMCFSPINLALALPRSSRANSKKFSG